MRHVFLSILGLGRPEHGYNKTTYGPLREDGQTCTTQFIQEARIREILDTIQDDYTVGDTLIVETFGTKEAKDKNWNNKFEAILQDIFASIPWAEYHFTLINTNNDAIGNWKLFELFTQTIKPRDTLYLDITHGFRSQPIFLVSAMQYKAALCGATISEITYGSFDKKSAEKGIVQPTWDLGAITQLQGFSHGLAQINERGDFGHLAKRCEELARVLNNQVCRIHGFSSQKGQDSVAALSPFIKLGSAFSTLATALDGCFLTGIPQLAQASLNALDQIDDAPPLFPELTPVVHTLRSARATLTKLAGPGELCAEQIHAQLNAAEFLSEKRRFHQGFTAFRETLVDMGMLFLDQKITPAPTRREIDKLVKCWSTPKNKAPEVTEIKALWEFSQTDPRFAQIGKIMMAFGQERNALNHAHEQNHSSAYVVVLPDGKDRAALLRKHLKTARHILSHIETSL